MRLPATGRTLPWQLVAAHEPGPIYFRGCSEAAGALRWVSARETRTVIFDDLRAIQLRCGYLPAAELQALSKGTQTPLYQIHSVASFYPHFQLTEPLRADVRVCADMSCHLNGACELRAELQQRFASAHSGEVALREVSCLGRCDHAPAASINDYIFTDLDPERAEALIRAAIQGAPLHGPHPEQTRTTCASDPYAGAEPYGVVRKLAQTRDWDGVLAELKASE